MAAVVVKSEDSLAYIPVNSIKANKEALREVDRKNPEYIELADSVRKNGVLEAIRVRAMHDPETGETFYGLINGLQRLTASKDAGLETIPALITSSDDFKVALEQIMTNATRVETKPVEYSKHLQRVLEMNPTMTCANLASMLSRSDSWIKERLRLTSLSPNCAKLVDEGAINIANGYALAKLPPEEQDLLIAQAQTLPASEFTPMAIARKKEIEKAKREGAEGKAPEFTPRQFLRNIADVKAERDSLSVGKAYISSQRITTPEAAWELALDWFLNADPQALAAQKAKFDEVQTQQNEKREKAKVEREKRKAAAAEIKSLRAKLELKLTEEHKSEDEINAALAAFDEEHKPKDTPKAE
ncbi:MAG: ParB/RepB/Spo0J family partition protein [Patescibacteria group bacterium]|nr:ParB/RepB/Spo0J family partition protein [Patescibacteria group bacterium]MDE2439227.1 ParB/RepB/Spo0J family partition protein [Patescibacteria group bacterium]